MSALRSDSPIPHQAPLFAKSPQDEQVCISPRAEQHLFSDATQLFQRPTDTSGMDEITRQLRLAEHWSRMGADAQAWWHVDRAAGMILERASDPSAIPSPGFARGSLRH